MRLDGSTLPTARFIHCVRRVLAGRSKPCNILILRLPTNLKSPPFMIKGFLPFCRSIMARKAPIRVLPCVGKDLFSLNLGGMIFRRDPRRPSIVANRERSPCCPVSCSAHPEKLPSGKLPTRATWRDGLALLTRICRRTKFGRLIVMS